MPEQTLGGIPLGLGMVMKINFLNFHVLQFMLIYILRQVILHVYTKYVCAQLHVYSFQWYFVQLSAPMWSCLF